MTSEEVLTCAINIGEQLLVSGAEISRVEDTIRRICNAYGIRQSHIFSIASCIIVTLETKERKWITQTRRILSYGTDMWKLDRLNDLSRRICATQPSFAVIDQEYEKILKGPTYSPAVQCGIYAMTAGAFAIFFGGNLWDGFASLFVGALIRVTLYALSAIKLKAIFSNILCSLISGMACILVCYLGIGQHVEMIMIGNIMLLIPGVLMTNSFRDFISGDMISGLLHFSEAMITAICVAAGFFGSLGFAIIYNIRGRRVLIPAIGGAVFWAVYLVFLHFVNNEYLGFFVVAILITIYSEIWARILKTPATTVLMPTVIPLIPGGSLYYAMDAALRHDAPEFILKAQKAIGLAVALAAGIMIVTSLRRPIEALVHIVAKKKY